MQGMQLTNSLESLLLIIRHLTLNSIQDVTTSNLLGREVKEKEEERIERKGNEEGVGKRGEDEVEGTGSKSSVPKYKCTHDFTLAYSSKMALSCGKLLRATTWWNLESSVPHWFAPASCSSCASWRAFSTSAGVSSRLPCNVTSHTDSHNMRS